MMSENKISKNVEIVPRKIVEMIIERCSISEKLVNTTTAMEVRDIRNYAESLLKQFEADFICKKCGNIVFSSRGEAE